jgi:hypothetical protein
MGAYRTTTLPDEARQPARQRSRSAVRTGTLELRNPASSARRRQENGISPYRKRPADVYDHRAASWWQASTSAIPIAPVETATAPVFAMVETSSGPKGVLRTGENAFRERVPLPVPEHGPEAFMGSGRLVAASAVAAPSRLRSRTATRLPGRPRITRAPYPSRNAERPPRRAVVRSPELPSLDERPGEGHTFVRVRPRRAQCQHQWGAVVAHFTPAFL